MWMMRGISIHLEGEERKPMKFIISETDEILISHSGLALAGALLQRTGIQRRANDIHLGERRRPEVSHGDVLTSMIGLLFISSLNLPAACAAAALRCDCAAKPSCKGRGFRVLGLGCRVQGLAFRIQGSGSRL